MEIESSNNPELASTKLAKAHILRDYTSEYKDFFIKREKGQKMTQSDSLWILNTFAKMRCDNMFFDINTTKIVEKVAQWCSVGVQTVYKLLKSGGLYDDNRAGINNVTRIPDSYKDIIVGEIKQCLARGFPPTSKYLQDILFEEDIIVSRRTICRTLKRWGINYGELKAMDNRRQRDYVIDNLKRYIAKLDVNTLLPTSCACNLHRCMCEFRKDIVYLDESYINQNHVSKYGYFIPEVAEKINKPSGKGPRIVMASALNSEGWLGCKQAEIVNQLKQPKADGSHWYKSIKYWIATSKKKDYHKNFDQEVFFKYFKTHILSMLTKPSIIVLDNASYHEYYDKNAFFPRKAKKGELTTWLDQNQISHEHLFYKADLLALVEQYCEPPENLLEKLAYDIGMQEFGVPHEILYTPQYHPELSGIEYAWSQVKTMAAYGPTYDLRRLKEEVLPNCFNVITEQRAKDIFTHLEKVKNHLREQHAIFTELANTCYQREFNEDYESDDEEEDDYDEDCDEDYDEDEY